MPPFRQDPVFLEKTTVSRGTARADEGFSSKYLSIPSPFFRYHNEELNCEDAGCVFIETVQKGRIPGIGTVVPPAFFPPQILSDV